MSISTLTILITLIGQVVVVPVYLGRWGVEIYGEWLVLTGTVSALTLLNLGIQSYVINLLIANYLRQEIPEGTQIFQSALLLYVLLGSLSLIALIGLIALPGVLSALNINTIPPDQARAIMAIYGLVAIYAIFGGLLMGLFRVVQQTPRQLAYGLLERLVFLFIPLIVVLAGGGPLMAAAALGVVFFCLTVIELVDIRRRSPYQLGLSAASWKTARSLIKPSLMFFLISVSATLLSTGMTVLISNLSGAAAVAIFTTTLMLTNLFRTVINQGLNVLWPEITSMATLNLDPELMARWQRLVIKLAGWLAMLAAAGTIVIGVDVLRWWTGGQIQVDESLVIILAVYLIVQSPFLVSTVFGLALSRQSDLARVNLVYISTVLLLSWILLGALGLNGAAWALLLAQAALLPWQINLACRWTSDRPASFVRSVLVRWLPGLIFILGVSFALLSVQAVWLRVILFIFSALLSMSLGWRVWLTGVERNSLWTEFGKAWQAYRSPQKTEEALS